MARIDVEKQLRKNDPATEAREDINFYQAKEHMQP